MKTFFTIILLTIGQCFGQSTLFDTKSGCKYVLPWQCDGCTMTWTGNCVDDLPDGIGVLTVSYESEVIMEYDGKMANGLFNGYGKYRDGMNEMEGYFSDDNYITSDTAAFSRLIKVPLSEEDPYSLYINDGQNNTKLYYYKLIPEGKPKGTLTIIPSGGETTEWMVSQISLHQAAADSGLIVIIPSINWGGIGDRNAEISLLDTIFKQVVNEHGVSKDDFILCGLSNGGMISLKYGIQAVKDSNTYLIPKGIIGLDPPLDFSRVYYSCERVIQRNFWEAGVNESKWLLSEFKTAFGGSPNDFPQKYVDGSIFSFSEENGGNAKYLTNIPIRMYSDLNIDFLVNQRKRDLYDWNGTDVVAFVNQLKINGNENSNVIITQNKGFRPDGSEHPHSWSIMDTKDALNWILNLL